MEHGASDGSIDDLGAFQALWFIDPDGMRVEISLITDPLLRCFHTPVRRTPRAMASGRSSG